MNILLGIVLFCLMGFTIALIACCIYGTALLFEETGGIRMRGVVRSRKHWEDRAHAWRLVSVIGFLVMVLDILMMIWGVRSPTATMVMLLTGGFVWAIAMSIAHDCQRHARRSQ